MTKKDYVKFAKMLKRYRLGMGDYSGSAVDLLEHIEDSIADIFADDNASFNPDKFHEECGYSEVK